MRNTSALSGLRGTGTALLWGRCRRADYAFRYSKCACSAGDNALTNLPFISRLL
jgi:hypothetical protein